MGEAVLRPPKLLPRPQGCRARPSWSGGAGLGEAAAVTWWGRAGDVMGSPAPSCTWLCVATRGTHAHNTGKRAHRTAVVTPRPWSLTRARRATGAGGPLPVYHGYSRVQVMGGRSRRPIPGEVVAECAPEWWLRRGRPDQGPLSNGGTSGSPRWRGREHGLGQGPGPPPRETATR